MSSASQLASRITAWLIVTAIVVPTELSNCAKAQTETGTSRQTLLLQMQAYRKANDMMELAFDRLLNRSTVAQQLALGNDQTVWLEQEQATCGPAGAINYDCETKSSVARATVLMARKGSPPESMSASRRPSHRTVPPTAMVALRLPLPPPAPPVATAMLSRPAPLPPRVVALQTPLPPRATTTATAVYKPAVPPPPMASTAAPASSAGTYFVQGTTMPWVWKQAGENQTFSFGDPDGTPPVVAPLTAFDAAPGDSLTIEVISGEIAIGGGGQRVDARGYAGFNGTMGPLGALPSTYIEGDPVNLGALVGVFTDAAGNILGSPFAVGRSETTQLVPPGAGQIQLGINNDVFGGGTAEAGNWGGFKVRITRSGG